MKSKKTVHIIHGIHTSEGDISTPAYLIPSLERHGYDVIVHEYGYVLGVFTRFQNPGHARKISSKIKDGDIVIAHSNGCYITWLMLRDYGIKPSGIVMLQPALDHDIVFEKGDYWINIFWNEHDKAVWFAKFLPFHHPFGDMGREGYTLDDSRVINFNTLKICGLGGHSEPYQKSREMQDFVVSSISERI